MTAHPDPTPRLPTMAEVLSSATVRYSPAVLDRALAAHDAQVAATALREAAGAYTEYDDNAVSAMVARRWLRDRADRIEREGGEE